MTSLGENHRPGHSAKIGLSRRQNLLGHLGLIDATGNQDRFRDLLAHDFGQAVGFRLKLKPLKVVSNFLAHLEV